MFIVLYRWQYAREEEANKISCIQLYSLQFENLRLFMSCRGSSLALSGAKALMFMLFHKFVMRLPRKHFLNLEICPLLDLRIR